jgi:tRNA(Ile)-lysidine synthase
VLAACSGGPDSLVLVDILDGFRLEYSFDLAVAHVDHMFRGVESAADADFVAGFCRERGLDCYRTAIDVPRYIKETGRSTEDAARIVRYEYLRQIAAKLGGAKIATGHHLDDQAETVLIHLLRGAGSTGIRGMQAFGGDIIRPLLTVSRQDIEQYCLEHQLTPRLDSSNLKTDYLRNRIRLKLLPDLAREYNPGIKDALCRSAAIIGDEHDYIRMMAKQAWPQVVDEAAGRLFINRTGLLKQHIAVRREIFRQAIEKKQGSLTGITFYHVERLIAVASIGQVGKKLKLPGGLLALNGYGRMELLQQQLVPSAAVTVPELTLTVPGLTVVPQVGALIKAEFLAGAGLGGNSQVAFFDWQSLVPPLVARTRLPGDRFQPLGLKGTKKLKDYFIDAKVPRALRDATLIICDNQGIIWVSGYRQAERGKVTGDTQKFLQLTILSAEVTQIGSDQEEYS